MSQKCQKKKNLSPVRQDIGQCMKSSVKYLYEMSTNEQYVPTLEENTLVRKEKNKPHPYHGMTMFLSG